MPDPNDYDDRDEFISDCVSQSMDEGYTQDEALGRCSGMWENKSMTTKAEWTRAYINDLPDSAFLYIEEGGEKDEDGKTEPRSLRKFPYKDKSGDVDLPHLRNAIARIPQAKHPDGEAYSEELIERLQSKARSILEEETEKMWSGVISDAMEAGINAQSLSAYVKELSLDDQEQIIRNAWYSQFAEEEEGIGGWDGPWVREVYEDKVIVETPEKEKFVYPYVQGDDSVTFGEPYEVEVVYKPKNLGVKIKSITDDTVTIGGYGVVWGGVDLEGDHFTKNTDFWFDRITENPMVLYDHGQDETVKREVVGRVTQKMKDDVGLWVESQLDRSNRYIEAIEPLIEEGRLGYSSGAVSHLVERTKSGWLKDWPTVEFSLTTTPAEPRLLGVQALRSLAETEPAYKTLIPEEGAEATSRETERERKLREAEISERLLSLDEMED